MPIFEYNCNECEKKFEKLLKNRNEEQSCPFCKSKNIKKSASVFSSKVENSRSCSAKSAANQSGTHVLLVAHTTTTKLKYCSYNYILER